MFEDLGSIVSAGEGREPLLLSFLRSLYLLGKILEVTVLSLVFSLLPKWSGTPQYFTKGVEDFFPTCPLAADDLCRGPWQDPRTGWKGLN